MAGSTGRPIAITDIAAYAHLSEADIEALGYELDAIRCDIEEPLRNLLLASIFEWGLAFIGVHSEAGSVGARCRKGCPGKGADRKDCSPSRQGLRAVPGSRSRWRRTFAANAVANLVRNL